VIALLFPEHFQAVVQCRQNGGKVFPDGFGASGQVDDQRSAAYPGLGAESMARFVIFMLS
jgi:hypothetical protein